jgi:hypothetical protein
LRVQNSKKIQNKRFSVCIMLFMSGCCYWTARSAPAIVWPQRAGLRARG